MLTMAFQWMHAHVYLNMDKHDILCCLQMILMFPYAKKLYANKAAFPLHAFMPGYDCMDKKKVCVYSIYSITAKYKCIHLKQMYLLICLFSKCYFIKPFFYKIKFY